MIPKRLQKEGFVFVKLKGKRPIEKNWQSKNNYSFNDPEILKWIKKGENYGICGGYGNLIIVDFDNLEVFNKYKSQLPDTFVIRTGSGKFHYYYECDILDSFKLFDSEDNTVADIQGIGKQAVAPGSTHPETQKKYRVFNNKPIAKIKQKFLKFIFHDYLRKRDKTDNPDKELLGIKNKIKIVDLLKKYNYNTSINPTMCKLGHGSKGGKCFSFDIRNNLWYCFHCDKGGDIFNLVMEHERVDFHTAKNIVIGKQQKADLGETKIYTLKQLLADPPQPPRWLVQDIVPEGGVTIFGGTSGCYKTWAAMQLCLSVSLGQDFMDQFETLPGTVLYIDEENGEVTLPYRFNILCEGHNFPKDNEAVFISIFQNITVDDPLGRVKLERLIKRLNPKLVIIDSLVRCLVGEEDKSTDIRKIFENVKPYLKEGISFIILHHTAKRDSKSMEGLRGSGDLAASADSVMMFSSGREGYGFVRAVKSRHKAIDQYSEWQFRLVVEDDSATLKWLKWTEEAPSSLDRGYNMFLDWVKTLNIVPNSTESLSFSTCDYLNHLKRGGLNKNIAYSVLKFCEENKDITKIKKGLYRINPLIAQIQEEQVCR